jgi:hypothetical protein
MIDKHLVVISRNWHEPFIRVSITDLDLKVVMSMEDFAAALAHEIGADVEKVQQTFDNIVVKMKQETARAV